MGSWNIFGILIFSSLSAERLEERKGHFIRGDKMRQDDSRLEEAK